MFFDLQRLEDPSPLQDIPHASASFAVEAADLLLLSSIHKDEALPDADLLNVALKADPSAKQIVFSAACTEATLQKTGPLTHSMLCPNHPLHLSGKECVHSDTDTLEEMFVQGQAVDKEILLN